jgi:hypothetical protein
VRGTEFQVQLRGLFYEVGVSNPAINKSTS